MTSQPSFGQWLKQRRKALDITCEDLAGRIGCAASTLYKIESDKRRPSKQIAALLAEHLNIPSEERSVFIHFARGEEMGRPTRWGLPFHSPTNLPAQPTVLIGRDEAVATVRKQLLRTEARLLTLIGPPGIGKTRLALQVGAQLLDSFADGVFFVSLVPITAVNLVSSTIANTLSVPDAGPKTPLERLKGFLRDKEMLLLLDNFEQILSAAPEIAEILAVCPLLRILVTSRSPLRIRQERLIPVPPLIVPDLNRLPTVESMTNYSAMSLFIERAQAVRPDFSLNDENAPTVAAICARLDGLPLAIELISARIKLLSPEALLERLDGRLMLQSDGLRDLEPRHRTLNAAIEWSFQLLTLDEQTLFWRLGVFVGGWTLEAAAAICMENLPLNLLDSLASLLDKNLVKQDSRFDSEPRFTMLETIREYALEQLVMSGEIEDLRRHHAEYFTKLAERADEEFRYQPVRWLNILEAELANFRVALAWSEMALRLAVALHEFWARRGHLNEGSRWLVASLNRNEVNPATSEHLALRAWAFHWLGRFNIWQGQLDAAQIQLENGLELFQELNNPIGTGFALGDLGMLFQMRGDHQRSTVLLEESLAKRSEIGDTTGIAWSLFFLGTLAYSQGDIGRAAILWEESLPQMHGVGDKWGIPAVLAHLAMVELERGNFRTSQIHLAESLTILWELDERYQIIHTLEVFACLAAVEGHQSQSTQLSLHRAARLFGVAEVLRETLSAPMLPIYTGFYERGIAAIRAEIDDLTLMATWAEGRTMTLEQAVIYALSE